MNLYMIQVRESVLRLSLPKKDKMLSLRWQGLDSRSDLVFILIASFDP